MSRIILCIALLLGIVSCAGIKSEIDEINKKVVVALERADSNDKAIQALKTEVEVLKVKLKEQGKTLASYIFIFNSTLGDRIKENTTRLNALNNEFRDRLNSIQSSLDEYRNRSRSKPQDDEIKKFEEKSKLLKENLELLRETIKSIREKVNHLMVGTSGELISEAWWHSIDPTLRYAIVKNIFGIPNTNTLPSKAPEKMFKILRTGFSPDLGKPVNIRIPNSISDFSGLTQLTQLKLLDISHNPISDFSFLVGMINLEELALDNTTLTSLILLSNHIKMKTLTCRGNQLKDLDGIQAMYDLEMLLCDDNDLNSIDALLTLLKGRNHLDKLAIKTMYLNEADIKEIKKYFRNRDKCPDKPSNTCILTN